eukprot:1379099-Prymnesium_polylepis.2
MVPEPTVPYDVLTVWGYVEQCYLKSNRWTAIVFRNRRPNPFGYVPPAPRHCAADPACDCERTPRS